MSAETELNRIMILKAEEKNLFNKVSTLERDILEIEKEIRTLVQDVNVRKAELRDSFDNWNRIRERLKGLSADSETVIRSQMEIVFDGGLVKSISVREIYAFGKSFKMEKEEIDTVLQRMHQSGEISYPKPNFVFYERK